MIGDDDRILHRVAGNRGRLTVGLGDRQVRFWHENGVSIGRAVVGGIRVEHRRSDGGGIAECSRRARSDVRCDGISDRAADAHVESVVNVAGYRARRVAGRSRSHTRPGSVCDLGREQVGDRNRRIITGASVGNDDRIGDRLARSGLGDAICLGDRDINRRLDVSACGIIEGRSFGVIGVHALEIETGDSALVVDEEAGRSERIVNRGIEFNPHGLARGDGADGNRSTEEGTAGDAAGDGSVGQASGRNAALARVQEAVHQIVAARRIVNIGQSQRVAHFVHHSGQQVHANVAITLRVVRLVASADATRSVTTTIEFRIIKRGRIDVPAVSGRVGVDRDAADEIGTQVPARQLGDREVDRIDHGKLLVGQPGRCPALGRRIDDEC